MVLIIIALQMPSANDPIALSGVLKKSGNPAEWKLNPTDVGSINTWKIALFIHTIFPPSLTLHKTKRHLTREKFFKT